MIFSWICDNMGAHKEGSGKRAVALPLTRNKISNMPICRNIKKNMYRNK